jgi:hypothetical protein
MVLQGPCGRGCSRRSLVLQFLAHCGNIHSHLRHSSRVFQNQLLVGISHRDDGGSDYMVQYRQLRKHWVLWPACLRPVESCHAGVQSGVRHVRVYAQNSDQSGLLVHTSFVCCPRHRDLSATRRSMVFVRHRQDLPHNAAPGSRRCYPYLHEASLSKNGGADPWSVGYLFTAPHFPTVFDHQEHLPRPAAGADRR